MMMDLTPAALAAQARELVRQMVALAVGEEMPTDWYEYTHPIPDVAEVQRLADAVAAALGAVRDAATAAERERCLRLAEKAVQGNLLYSVPKLLAALRGDDHE